MITQIVIMRSVGDSSPTEPECGVCGSANHVHPPQLLGEAYVKKGICRGNRAVCTLCKSSNFISEIQVLNCCPTVLLLGNLSATIGLVERLPISEENLVISVQVRCYAELNDDLPAWMHQRTFPYEVRDASTVGDLTQALGLSEVVVDLVLVNGKSVGWSHKLSAGDRVSLYPVFESFDIADVTRLRPEPLRQPRFVLDVHLGKLANHLRMVGFDTAYSNHAHDSDLVKLATEEARTLLSKDRELLQNESLPRRYFVRATDPRHQLIEVLRRFDLFNSLHPFTRCIECNTPLVQTAKEDILHHLPPKMREMYNEFQLCQRCNRVYWKGSHYERMREFVEGIKAER